MNSYKRIRSLLIRNPTLRATIESSHVPDYFQRRYIDISFSHAATTYLEFRLYRLIKRTSLARARDRK